MKLLLCIPTYNEAENLTTLVADVLQVVPEAHILVIDDNSPDGTGQIADQLGQTYPGKVFCLHRPGKSGLGTAYISGFRWAMEHGYEAVGQMDADFSHPVDKIPLLIAALGDHPIAIGSRYVPGGSLDDRWPFWRKALSAWGNFYARSILGMKLRDVTGGFRLWRVEVLKHMPLDRIRSNGYVFQVEMAYVANLLGYQATELPIHFADRRWGKSKMNFRIQVEAALRVWQLLGMYRDLRANKP